MSVVCIYSRDEQCRHPHTHACKKETETLDTITQQTTHLSNHFYTICYSTQPLGASATAWKKELGRGKTGGYYTELWSLTPLLILTSCIPLYTTFPNTLGCDKSAMLMKISSAGCLYSGARNLFWSRWCPMKPIERPSTNKPFSVPIWMHVNPRTS